ncbi:MULTISPECIES: hypothetical protein [unclassified Streptomyces]|uniref:hypothetical protein n=1 Tax=unclassified Streptomyces TaxID=2593676 RepID=UPI0022B6D1E9|nr:MULTISPECIES: hypothetical protein [unclassified Streptomyces]MCZ7415732.1 hypothetical protein [Streptomyces sp. WMMC897]MCZ7434457.1 hypothetical protein [Streptomyces sp. WMMC1477]
MATPVYTALLRQWAAQDRALPGRVDAEWAALADYASWRARSVPDRRPHPPRLSRPARPGQGFPTPPPAPPAS